MIQPNDKQISKATKKQKKKQHINDDRAAKAVTARNRNRKATLNKKNDERTTTKTNK